MKRGKKKSTSKVYNDLAIERTMLSNQRTTLSYIRTGLTAFLLGLALVQIFHDKTVGLYIGGITSLIGISFIIVGMVYHSKEKRMIEDEKHLIDEIESEEDS